MKPGGPEAMRQAGQKLGELTRVIKEGDLTQISMPKEVAAMAFRIPRDAWEALERRGRELGIGVKGEQIIVELRLGERNRREVYFFLYGIAQQVFSGGRPRELIGKIPKEILEANEGLREIMDVIKTGRSNLPDEDLTALQLYLAGLWFGLKDKTDLPAPWDIYKAVSY